MTTTEDIDRTGRIDHETFPGALQLTGLNLTEWRELIKPLFLRMFASGIERVEIVKQDKTAHLDITYTSHSMTDEL